MPSSNPPFHPYPSGEKGKRTAKVMGIGNVGWERPCFPYLFTINHHTYSGTICPRYEGPYLKEGMPAHFDVFVGGMGFIKLCWTVSGWLFPAFEKEFIDGLEAEIIRWLG